MVYLVSITSQGQVAIPAQIRRDLGLSKRSKAIVSVKENGEINLKPVKDLLDLGGILHHKAIKNKSIEEIIKLEDEAIRQGVLEKFKRKLKDSE